MSLVYVNNLYSGNKDVHSNFSIFPVVKMNAEKLTFIAHFSPDINIDNITKYPKLTLYPIHLRNTYCLNNFDELAKRNSFVFLCVTAKTSTVYVYVPHILNPVVYNGKLEVIIRNDVVGDNRGESEIKFPNCDNVKLMNFDDKLRQAFDVISDDFLKYVRSQMSPSEAPKLRALKEQVRVNHFPEHLVKVEPIARPVVSQAAGASLPPATSSAKPKDKSLFSRLFS